MSRILADTTTMRKCKEVPLRCNVYRQILFSFSTHSTLNKSCSPRSHSLKNTSQSSPAAAGAVGWESSRIDLMMAGRGQKDKTEQLVKVRRLIDEMGADAIGKNLLLP